MELGREKGKRQVAISVYVGWAGGEGAIVSQDGKSKATRWMYVLLLLLAGDSYPSH
jgi:hypothetical protein